LIIILNELNVDFEKKKKKKIIFRMCCFHKKQNVYKLLKERKNYFLMPSIACTIKLVDKTPFWNNLQKVHVSSGPLFKQY
jgi:hypothetical protein